MKPTIKQSTFPTKLTRSMRHGAAASAIVFASLTSATVAGAVGASELASAQRIESHLDREGRLNVPNNYRGSFDARGYELVSLP